MKKGDSTMIELTATLTILLFIAYTSFETMVGRVEVQIISR